MLVKMEDGSDCDSSEKSEGDPFSPGRKNKLRKLNPDLSASMYMRMNYYENTSIVQISPNIDDYTKVTSDRDSLVSLNATSEDFKFNSSQVSLISDEGFDGQPR